MMRLTVFLTAIAIILTLGVPATAQDDAAAFDDTRAGPGEWGFRPRVGEVTQVTPPGFSWRPQEDAAIYHLQVTIPDDDAFEQPVYEVEDVEMTVHCPPHTLPAGDYRWRVAFLDDDGNRSAWSEVRQFSIAEDALDFPLPPMEELLERLPDGHPRLFMRPEELEWLRELAAGPLNERFEALVAAGQRIIDDPPPTDDYPPFPEGVERPSPEWARHWRAVRPYMDRALGDAILLGFVYQLGGPEEHGQMARQMVVEVSQWDPSGTTSLRYNSEAGMRYAWQFPRAYTFVRELLTEEERERCREVMQIRGNELYNALYPRHLWRPFGSHNNRRFHFLGEIAIAFIDEIPEARDWLEFSLNVFFNVYPVWSDDDGGWHEGVGYWHGYISLVSIWIDIMQSALGIDGFDKPFFSETGYYPIYAQPPDVPRLTFGDTTGTRNPSNVRRLMTWLTEGTANEYWNDYLQLIGGPSHQGGYIGFMRAARLEDEPEIGRRSVGELPLSRLFEGTGIAYLHSDLTDSNNNVQISFKSSPFGKQSHGNEANNSFELYAYGEPLLIRTGTRELHGSPHHREWVWATKSCNSILVNGEGEKSNRAAAVGRISTFEHTNDFDYLVGEAGDAYDDDVLLRYDRHLLFVRPDLVVVMDDLEAPEASTFQYLLHAPAEMQVNDQDDIGVEVGEAGLRISLLTPEGLEITQTDEFDTPPQEHIQLDEWHLTAATTEPAATRQFVALMRPHRLGDEVPVASELQRSPAGHAIRAALADGSVIVLWRNGPGELSGWGLSTEADLAAIRLDAEDNPVAFFTSGRGEARWNGDLLGQ